ncbi:Uncharacterised protein [Mycobacteroides abscessus subsp. abscessus]|nr:Uncharacterised protein [Mycobacteroides abscessus subsp. abscessus]SIG02435.1 Uncharacterised protein [Mycobacteroides abscessus subsp. abscessus]SIG29860.1 Uncharacterised protein [Mycobacteroides abscessus subsp. abscessus]
MSRLSAFNAGTSCLGRLIPCEQSVAYHAVRTPTAEIVGLG